MYFFQPCEIFEIDEIEIPINVMAAYMQPTIKRFKNPRLTLNIYAVLHELEFTCTKKSNAFCRSTIIIKIIKMVQV
jgi:hypothetical protein